jgi:hypothetical protein
VGRCCKCRGVSDRPCSGLGSTTSGRSKLASLLARCLMGYNVVSAPAMECPGECFSLASFSGLQAPPVHDMCARKGAFHVDAPAGNHGSTAAQRRSECHWAAAAGSCRHAQSAPAITRSGGGMLVDIMQPER